MIVSNIFGGGINWCVVSDIQKNIYTTKETLTKLGLQKCSAKLWPEDSLIISLGATIGKVGIAKKPTATKQGLSGIIINPEKIIVEYLYYVLSSLTPTIVSMATGNTIKEVRPAKLKDNLEIPLPSIKEQRGIVARIMKEERIIEDCENRIEQKKLEIKSQIKKLWRVPAAKSKKKHAEYIMSEAEAKEMKHIN